ncbi:coenzyme-B sulfoethylthiotransferase subunit beta [Methanonatronarchaeum sp. AMET-Sl]|uniref:coenzyme-B sulfoethylthiotransferase subunit beta n=1 Tax=Methanonatronarchaeum sp. AMET-Sl TaxID=3037654 RepID=UPI00244DD3AD|nr:coenzyme-B sulfoethylthiotransferase subunit beta [Methanonatronarchaeum sp. AMET-Sl]WGI16693.1 coenzyme-B sulfoethylthiotransferase subunit beta [Methanonatronarchaeum sp. AMET-Sl]
MEDNIDLYSDRGELLESDVPLKAISPLHNNAIKKTFSLAKRMVVADLAGMEKDLSTGQVGGLGIQLKGRELDLDIISKAEEIAKAVEEKIKVKEDDDTSVEIVADGERLFIRVPEERFEAGVEYTTGLSATASAVTEAVVETFDVDMFDSNMVHAAVWGRYPQTVELTGSNLDTLLDIPQRNEGIGYALRNIMVNDVVASTQKNAMQATALSMVLEQGAMYETGDAVGSFERKQLLELAYGGLNADNIVYSIVEENASDGTVGDVVESIVGRALDDGVIEVKENLPSGYDVYKTNDSALWNAYATAGMMAAIMVNCGAMRAAQAVPSTILYYNNLIERETSLPGVDFGRAEGTSVGMSFFSHSIYGGGGPGIFKGNHIVTRHAKGAMIPAISAGVALDAGTQMMSPEATSSLKFDTFGEIPEFRTPMDEIAKAATQVKGELA